MRKRILKTLKVKITHDFGIVDTFEDGWDSQLSLEAEVYEGQSFLRLQLYQSKRGSSRSVGFSFCTSPDEHFNTGNAVDFFQQIERCWQNKLGTPYQQGRIGDFIDRKLFGLTIVRVLDEIPTRVHDPYATHKLECQRRNDGREFCMIRHNGRKNDVVGSIITFPRASLAKIINALQTQQE